MNLLNTVHWNAFPDLERTSQSRGLRYTEEKEDLGNIHDIHPVGRFYSTKWLNFSTSSQDQLSLIL